MCPRMHGRVLMVIVAVAFSARVARAAWVVDEHGECVQQWTSASLGRGPTAMLEAPLVPFRSGAGGVRLALDDQRASGAKKAFLVPTLAFLGGSTGVLEAVIWMVGGLADTVSGGYFEIAPEEATELSAAPLVPVFVPDGRRRPAGVDRCGRKVG
jgi:hypothetical protein